MPDDQDRTQLIHRIVDVWNEMPPRERACMDALVIALGHVPYDPSWTTEQTEQLVYGMANGLRAVFGLPAVERDRSSP